VLSLLLAENYYNMSLETNKLKVALHNYHEALEELKPKLDKIDLYKFEEALHHKANSSVNSERLSSISIALDEFERTSSPAVGIVTDVDATNGIIVGVILFLGVIMVVYLIQCEESKRFFNYYFENNTSLDLARDSVLDNLGRETHISILYIDNILQRLGEIRTVLFESPMSIFLRNEGTDALLFEMLEQHMTTLLDLRTMLDQTQHSFQLNQELLTAVLETRSVLARAIAQLMIVEERTANAQQLLTIMLEADSHLVIATTITGIGL